jgi:hypothetical protein
MTAIPFDVFAFTHSLVDSGIPNNQADTIAQAFSKAIQESNETVIEQTKVTIEHFKSEYKLDDVATNKSLDARITETELKIELVRKDIEIIRAELKRDIEGVKTDIEKSRNDLIKWFLGTAFAIASIGFMLARFFTHGVL